MKYVLASLIVSVFMSMSAYCQRVPQVPDSVRKKQQILQDNNAAEQRQNNGLLNRDSLIKIRLINLALNNPAMQIAHANVRIAESGLSKAKTSWLSSLTAGANVNEFVIQGSAAASFFPKYNVGLVLPFDIFTRMKNDKTIARENIVISEEVEKDRRQMLKAEVLIAYENYKEKSEIVLLQKSSIEYDFSAYEAAQSSFAGGDITMEEMNKMHQVYLTERTKLVSKEKELNIAIIQLEQIVGVPLSEALKVK